MAQVSTSPTRGADEFARIAGNAMAMIVRCGLDVGVTVALSGMVQNRYGFAVVIIPVDCDICVIFCNDDRELPVIKWDCQNWLIWSMYFYADKALK